MLLGTRFEAFMKESPASVMVHGVLERALNPGSLDELDNRLRGRETEDAALGPRGGVHDLAVGQVARVEILVVVSALSSRQVGFVVCIVVQLPQDRAVEADLVDAVAVLRRALVGKGDIRVVEREFEMAEQSAV